MDFNETIFTTNEFKLRGNILKPPKFILQKKKKQVFKAKVEKKKSLRRNAVNLHCSASSGPLFIHI